MDVSRAHSKNVFNHMACAWYLLDEGGSLKVLDAPHNLDRKRALELAAAAGLRLDVEDGQVEVSGVPVSVDLDDDACSTRISVCQAIVLAARTGRASMRLGGGCNFAPRPVDLHLAAVAATGGAVRDLGGNRIEVCFDGPPKAARFDARTAAGVSSVGASATSVLLAMLSDGESQVVGLNDGPEVTGLVALLRRAGAMFETDGTLTRLQRPEGGFTSAMVAPIPLDQTAVGTYALMGLARWASVLLRGARVEDLAPAFATALWKAGVVTLEKPGGVLLSRAETVLRAASIVTGTGSAFPTDLAPSWSAFMSLARGESHVLERVYPTRTSHLAQLRRAGVLVADGGSAGYVVTGPTALTGRPRFDVHDIRCGDAALVMAAAHPQGAQVVDRRRHLRRGHPQLASLMSQFGIDLIEE